MRRGISVFSDLIALLCLAKIFVKLKPDMIHSYGPKAGFLSTLAGFALRVKVRIHTFTGLIFPSRRGLLRSLLIITDKITSYCSTVIVAESKVVRDDLLSINIPSKCIKMIGYGNIAGVDETFFYPTSINAKNMARRFFGIPDNAFVF